MGLYREGTAWVAEVTCAGRRHRRRGGDRAALQRWHDLTKLTGEVAPWGGGLPKAAHPLGAVAREARASRVGWKATRDTSLDQRLEVAIAFLGPEKPVGAIDHAGLLGYVRHLETSRTGNSGRLSAKTINRYLAAVSGVLDYARACAYTTATPTVPWQTEAPGRLEFLTLSQEHAICDQLKGDHALVVRVLVATGLRAGELWGLTLDQIETDWLRVWITKSDSPRSVPIDPALSRPLRALVAVSKLPSHADVYRAFKAATAALGLSDGLCLHSLRHTTGTRLAQAGVSGPVIQRYLGHSDYRTTQRYVHLADADLVAASVTLRQPVARSIACAS